MSRYLTGILFLTPFLYQCSLKAAGPSGLSGTTHPDCVIAVAVASPDKKEVMKEAQLFFATNAGMTTVLAKIGFQWGQAVCTSASDKAILCRGLWDNTGNDTPPAPLDMWLTSAAENNWEIGIGNSDRTRVHKTNCKNIFGESQ